MRLGSTPLALWLNRHSEIRQARIAEASGIDPGDVCRYVSGVLIPGLLNATRVEKATRMATGDPVLVSEWLPWKEADGARRVRRRRRRRKVA